MKFDSITFTTKDVIMIVGGAISAFTFYLKIDTRLNEFEINMQKIISQNEINDVKVNARIDRLKPTSNNNQKIDTINFYAVIPSNRLEVRKKKLFNHKLI